VSGWRLQSRYARLSKCVASSSYILYDNAYTCPDHAIQSRGLCRARSKGVIPSRVCREHAPEGRRCAHPEYLGQSGLPDKVRLPQKISSDSRGKQSRRVIAEVRQSVDARITSVNKKSKFLKFAKRLIEAKEETDTIRGLEQKIQNVVVEFQVRIVFTPRSVSALI
jgi:hypothetical protein